jgi:hypothetical protein
MRRQQHNNRNNKIIWGDAGAGSMQETKVIGCEASDPAGDDGMDTHTVR